MFGGCIGCWETPCACGHEYRDWSVDRLKKFRDMIDKLIEQKEAAEPEPEKEKVPFIGPKLLDYRFVVRSEQMPCGNCGEEKMGDRVSKTGKRRCGYCGADK